MRAELKITQEKSSPSVEPTPEEILAHVPQQSPFRFVDRIIEVNEKRISGTYTFRRDETFYAGHFPGNPITPGVILLESMCQIGIVAHGVYLFALENNFSNWKEKAREWTTFFSDAETEFYSPVYPGDTVEIRAERIYWRRQKLRSQIRMYRDGKLIAECTASGIGVRNVHR